MAVMLFAGCAGALVSDDASAESVASANVVLSETKVVTGGEFNATLTFTEQDLAAFSNVRYEAKVINSDGKTQSGAIDINARTFTEAEVTQEIKITAPSTAGTYTLVVDFVEKIKDEGGSTITKEAITVEKTFKVCNPVVLSLTVTNNGTLNITDAIVYFYVDDVMIEESKTLLTVDVGSEKTITYDYFDRDMSSGKHTFMVMPADQAYMISGLGESHSFYYEQTGQDYIVWIMAVIFVVVLAMTALVFRKPVKNYGKPKSRR